MKIDPTKIEIPKEEIDQITAKYHCSDEDAVRAYLNAREAETEAYNQTLGDILGTAEDEEASTLLPPSLYTPAQIKAHLDNYVIGQEDYKKRLSIAAAYNFAIVHALREGKVEEIALKRFRKKNTLISGPSGSGKTYCAEILGDFLDVPTLIIDATDYTEAGYVGKTADDMIRELINIAPGNSKSDKVDYLENYGGIIFIDEIDKKAKDGKTIGHDISREGFQRAVLKLIERKQISVEDPMSPAGQISEFMQQQRGGADGKRKGSISTENILFVLGGSFQRYPDDLESIVKKRIERGERGIKEDGSVTVTGFVGGNGKEADEHHNYYRQAQADDYIQFGLIPELVGRAPVRTYVNSLSKNDLIRIMTETKDSIVEQYRFEFSLFGIDLSFSEDALLWIASKAENQKTGARALISVFENMLTDFQFELPGKNFKELHITGDICESPRDAMLAMMTRSPFLDFLEKFKRDQGIELVFDENVEDYIKEYAGKKGIQVSTAIENMLSGASALNFMNWQGPFTVTREMVQSPGYFDRLYVKWHQEQVSNGITPPPPPQLP